MDNYQYKKELSIVVPCFNEEDSIPLFYKEVDKILNNINLLNNSEYVFVDDGSKDKTCSILRELAKTDDRVKYISFSRNFGKEAAMYAGFQNACGRFVVCLDADLQHPPVLFEQMYKLITTGDYDCVEARRTTRTNEPIIRTVLSHAFYKFLNLLSDVKIEDGSGDFRMMNRKYINSILSLKEKNRFSKGIFPWIGFKTHILEFENIERVAGTSKWSFLKLFSYSMDGILGFSSKPLFLSALIGVFSLAVSIFWIIELIARKIIFDNSIEGWSSIMCCMLFIGGLLLFCIGIVGLYISKIYTEIKQRPIYLVEEDNINKDDIPVEQ